MTFINSWVYGITFLLITFLIFLVLSTKRNKTNIYFALTLFFLLGWAYTLYYYYFLTTSDNVDVIGRLNFVAAILFAPTLYIFARNFPFPRKSSYREGLITIETFLLALVAQFTPTIVASEVIVDKTDRITTYGPWYILFLLHFIGHLLLTLYEVRRQRTQATGLIKAQLTILYKSIFYSLIFGITTNIIVPTLFTDYHFITLQTYTAIQNLGPFSSIIFGVPITYSILRYQFLDVRILLGKIVNRTVLAITVVTIFYTVSFAQQEVFGSIYKLGALISGSLFAILFVVYFESLSKYVERTVEQYIVNPFYDATEKIKSFNLAIGSVLDSQKLLRATVNLLTHSINPSGAFIFFNISTNHKNDSTHSLGTLHGRQFAYRQFLDKKKYGIAPVLIEKAIDGLDSQPQETSISLLTGLGIQVLVPITKGDEMYGLLFLSGRKSELPYTTTDLAFLESVADTLAWSLARANLYKEIENFNANLKDKVKIATKALKEKLLELDQSNKLIEEKNAQLKVALAELKTLDNAKSEFISIASHQLRTPISIIKGYLSMLNEGDFGDMSESQDAIIRKTTDNVEQLNNIIDDILNASRIERGNLNLAIEQTDLISLIRSVVEQLKNKAINKGLKLSFDSTVPQLSIDIDKNKIYEVVMNMVDNAINYTLKGSITVTCSIASNSHTLAIITVKDTGIGIPRSFRNKIFKRFSRSENAREIRPDGTGIGLYVAKSFIEAHKGSIEFESRENKGTTFTIKLPLVAQNTK